MLTGRQGQRWRKKRGLKPYVNANWLRMRWVQQAVQDHAEQKAYEAELAQLRHAETMVSDWVLTTTE